MDNEALAEWRANPVTQAVLEVLRKGAEWNKQRLQAVQWAQGTCDPEALGRCKAQIELVEDLEEATADEWNDWVEHFRHSPG